MIRAEYRVVINAVDDEAIDQAVKSLTSAPNVFVHTVEVSRELDDAA